MARSSCLKHQGPPGPPWHPQPCPGAAGPRGHLSLSREAPAPSIPEKLLPSLETSCEVTYSKCTVSWGRRSTSCHVWESTLGLDEERWRAGDASVHRAMEMGACLGISLFILRKLPSPLFPGRWMEFSLSSFHDLRNLINDK